MPSADDILRQLATSEIVELKDFYSNYTDEYPHIYSFLKTALKWRQTRPEYITIFAVEGEWKSDGTFIALLTFSCYDIFLHSLDTSGEKLLKGLSRTQLIDWHQNEVLFYATHATFRAVIYQALSAIDVRVKGAAVTHLWQLSERTALQLPEAFVHGDFYMDAIKPEDAEEINRIWPPAYRTSLEYLRTFIVMNGGYGIYERGTDQLVSWILCNMLGQLGVLQTKEGYFRKGFGLAVTTKLTKAVAQNGDHPIGTVHDGNVSSEALFAKLGFEKKYACNYIRAQKRPQ